MQRYRNNAEYEFKGNPTQINGENSFKMAENEENNDIIIVKKRRSEEKWSERQVNIKPKSCTLQK